MSKPVQKLEEEHNKLMRVIFGEDEEKGMKDKVDEMHDILVSVKSLTNIGSSVATFIKWCLIIVAGIALMKGWLSGVVAYILK